MFTLKHQDEDITYTLEKGGFCIEDSKLYLSLENKALDNDAFPDAYLFAIDGHPINGELKNCKIHIKSDSNDKIPNAYVYTTFHANYVEANLLIEEEKDNAQIIKISLSVISDDPIYYDENAKLTEFVGSVELHRKQKSDLLIPS